MSAGQLVSPLLANKIIASRLSQDDVCGPCASGVLLDGFPRELSHLADLDAMLHPLGLQVNAAINIEVTESTALGRLAGRRVCPSCKAIYSMSSGLTDCTVCGTALERRADDSAEEVVRKRIALAQEGLGPLLRELAHRDLLFNFKADDATAAAVAPAVLASKIAEVLCYPDRFYESQTAYSKLNCHFQHLSRQLHLEQSIPADSAEGSGGTGSGRSFPFQDTIRQLAVAFRDLALHENSAKRTGALRRFVFLLTASREKLLEVERVLDRYGVEVIQTPPLPDEPELHDSIIEALLALRSPGLVPVAVLREQTCLLRPLPTPSATPYSDESHGLPQASLPLDRARSTMRAGVLADHLSRLCVWTRADVNKAVQYREFTHTTHGRIRAQGKSECWSTGAVFGWDSQFEVH